LEENILKTFSLLQETIEAYSQNNKCLLNTVNPDSSNPIPQAFYTIFMAFFQLIIDSKVLPADPHGIMKALQNLQKKLDLSNRYATIQARKNNINQTKGLIQNYFAKQDTPSLGQGVELVQNLKNSLLRSHIETTKYECKQGILDLSIDRKINSNLLQNIIETICGIANSEPDTDGYIFWGVADKKQDADKIEELDNITPIEINKRYIVGIDREAKILKKSLEKYVERLVNAIRKSSLTDPLKTQVVTKIDTITYKGLSVIRINVPSQKDLSYVDNKVFMRVNSSTREATGPEIVALYQIFQKNN